jgi:hypothetical protein
MKDMQRYSETFVKSISVYEHPDCKKNYGACLLLNTVFCAPNKEEMGQRSQVIKTKIFLPSLQNTNKT